MSNDEDSRIPEPKVGRGGSLSVLLLALLLAPSISYAQQVLLNPFSQLQKQPQFTRETFLREAPRVFLSHDDYAIRDTIQLPPTPNKSNGFSLQHASMQTDLGSEEDSYGPYQWRGLIWQTVEFNEVENGVRIAADPVMRDNLAHKPFWHDWIASNHQWNMGRWSDGDDFLVDDVGHPMQGAISAYIEIQNSPADARIEWGDPGYAKSRFKGFLWATVFSTNEKIGPTGETGVGSEGAFTYGNECLEKCNSSNFGPGRGDSKYTNNTGWTDYIITPTVGMLWVFGEDFADRKIGDPVSAAFPNSPWPKLLRAGLTPTRSFANILRWHMPWYRDSEHSPLQEPRLHWFHSDDENAWRAAPRFQIAPYLSAFSIATNTAACFNCRRSVLGQGIEGTAHMRGWLGFDSAVSYHSDASPLPSDRAGGNMLVALFGLSAGKQWRYYSAHLIARQGMVRFSQAYVRSPVTFIVPVTPYNIGTTAAAPATAPQPGVIDANGTPLEPKLGDINHFAWDVGLSVDHKFNRIFGIRAGMDEAVVRYRTDKVDPPSLGQVPYFSWLSKQNFLNRGNHSYQLGPTFSF